MENTFGADYLESMDIPCYQGGSAKSDCIDGGGVWLGGKCYAPGHTN